jgi:hypothetical protein
LPSAREAVPEQNKANEIFVRSEEEEEIAGWGLNPTSSTQNSF